MYFYGYRQHQPHAFVNKLYVLRNDCTHMIAHTMFVHNSRENFYKFLGIYSILKMLSLV